MSLLFPGKVAVVENLGQKLYTRVCMNTGGFTDISFK